MMTIVHAHVAYDVSKDNKELLLKRSIESRLTNLSRIHDVLISELQTINDCTAATQNTTVCLEQLNAADISSQHPVYNVPCA